MSLFRRPCRLVSISRRTRRRRTCSISPSPTIRLNSRCADRRRGRDVRSSNQRTHSDDGRRASSTDGAPRPAGASSTIRASDALANDSRQRAGNAGDMRTRTDQIRASLRTGLFGEVYVPAFQAKDLPSRSSTPIRSLR